MSEAQKPAEESVVAPTATETPAITEPAEETKAVETPAETATETPAPATTEAAAEAVTETAAETPAATTPKKEVTPFEEGVLGYKAPGLIKSLLFSKKFFWLGSEPIEIKHLTSYLRGEKAEAANHNAAWSAHTGKGLLYFSKKATDKTTPAGIINLSEASDLTEDGTVEFFFHVHGQKHTFQSSSLADRDNWVAVLKTKAAEAKEIAESVTGSETYKEHHSNLSKPIVVAAAAITAPKKSTEVKKEEKAEAKEEKAEAKEEKKEEKITRKSRSASRKRTSIFSGILGKKEEATPTAAPAETTTTAAEPAPLDGPAEAEAVVAAPVVDEVTPPATSPTEAGKPATTKRNSIFGQIQSRFSQKDKKSETEAAPAVPAKDAAAPTEPSAVSETAPVIPVPEATEPLVAGVTSPATVPIETTEAPVINGATTTEVPAVKSEKRKSSLSFGFGNRKEKAATSDEETEKPKSPFAKLRATVKGRQSPKAEKTPEKVSEPAAEPAATTETPAVANETTPAPTSDVVSEPVPAAHASTAQVSAAA